MVFSNLQSNEKEAFFSLLDELCIKYFTSRPEVIAQLAAQSRGSSANANAVASKAASAVRNAVASKPDIVPRFGSLALGHRASPSSSAANEAHDDEPEQPVSVAARMAAFAARNTNPPPPARGPPPVAPKPPASGLAPSKTFGGIDTTSTKNALGSIYANRSSAKPTEPPQPSPAPPTFSKRSNFAPPPTRGAAPSSSPPPPQPEEEQGEWAEALYDYNSNEQADLNFKEDDRILIVERTSDDWWTGECNGRKGLLPASYVKLL